MEIFFLLGNHKKYSAYQSGSKIVQDPIYLTKRTTDVVE